MPGMFPHFDGLDATAAVPAPAADAFGGPLRADGLDACLVAVTGRDAAWTFTIRPVDPDLVLPEFTGGEVLAGSIWAGLDAPALAVLAGEWVDIEAGTARLRLRAADAADLAPGTYNLEVTLEGAGVLVAIHYGLLRVRPARGQDATAPLGPLYSSYEEVRELAWWIDDHRQLESDRARWDRPIWRGSQWVHGEVRARFRRWYGYGTVSTRDSCGGSCGTSATYTTTAARLDEALAAGGLDASDWRLREACTRYVLANVPAGEQGDPLTTPGGGGGGAARTGREAELIRANLLLLGTTFRIDADGDGIYEWELPP